MGIGKSCVELLAAEGAAVALADREAAEGKKVVNALAAKGRRVMFIEQDAKACMGIRVNSVHPGYIWTPMVENGIKSTGHEEEMKSMFESLRPVGHLGAAIDVAYGVLYLASDESVFTTGSELVIDGGYTAQ